MGYASVDIDALASLTKAVDAAHDTISTASGDITTRLAGSPVDVSGLAKALEIASWMQDAAPTLKTQLGYARWLEASTPGIQGTVRYDQLAVPTLTYDQAKALANQAHDLMKPGEEPSQELLDLLNEYGGNPTFALLLMNGYRAGDGYATMTLGPNPDLDYLADLPTGPNGERFLQLYSQILGGLSSEFPPTELDGNNPSDYRAMALLASRGSWHATWLTQLGNDIIAAEKDDPRMWTRDLVPSGSMGEYDSVPSVLTPEGIEMKDPMVWLMDALSRNPDAAADFFNGGGEAPVKADGETVDIGANLRWLTLERPWLEDGGLSLALGLAAATSSDDTAFAHDFDALNHLDPKEKESWYSFLGHLGLDVIGLVPELGDWADGINIAWYLAEGDYVNAGTAGAAAVPVFGSTATIAKWIKRLNAAGDLAGMALDAKQLKEMLEDLPFTDQDPDAVPGTRGAGPPEPVPPGATFLTDPPDGHWYDERRGLQKTQTYVAGGGSVVFETNAQGRIEDVRGNLAALTPEERAWIRDHTATT